MKTFHFKYGSGAVDLPLPQTGRIQELYGPTRPAVDSIPQALEQALEHPVHQQPLSQWLKPGVPVTLIISDMSRFWMRQDRVIPHLVDYMNRAGIPDEDIVILVANGTHLGGDEEELRTLVTPEIYSRISVVNHDCRADDLVFTGVTDQGNHIYLNPLAVGRQVVALGACTHHVMAGFGGGRKSILPGISGLDTIRYNHAMSLDPKEPHSNPAIGNGVLEGNPLHLDMCGAAQTIGDHLYVVNLVMNAQMELGCILAGHWRDSWLEACKAASDMYETPIAEKGDVVITSCGGYPKDMSLYQGTKAIDNVEPALKPGGTLVLLAECREGGGPPEYFDWLEPLKRGTLDAELRQNFTIPGYIFYLNCEQAQRYRVLMLTTADPEALALMGVRATADPQELLSWLDLEDKLTYIIPNGSTVIPTLKGEV